MNEKKITILFVDDEPLILKAIENSLFRRRKVWSMKFAIGAQEALEILATTPCAVIVADMRMPGMDGIQLLREVKEKYSNIIRIMLTGTADIQTAIDAINTGEVFRFLSKPTTTKTLEDAIEAGLKQVRLIEAESRLLRETLTGTINLLYDLMASIDPVRHSRGLWMRDTVREVAQSIDILKGRWEIEVAALLSQVGAISLPRELLKDRLSGNDDESDEKDRLSGNGDDDESDESELSNLILETGTELVGRIPYLEAVSKIIRYQHKRFDGSGFPEDSVAGHDIPLGARVLKILHDFRKYDKQYHNRYRIQTRMRSVPGVYDTELMELIIPICPLPYGVEAEENDRLELYAKDLKVGHKLLSHVRTVDNVIVVGAGNRLSPTFLARIKSLAANTGIQEPIVVLATD